MLKIDQTNYHWHDFDKVRQEMLRTAPPGKIYRPNLSVVGPGEILPSSAYQFTQIQEGKTMIPGFLVDCHFFRTSQENNDQLVTLGLDLLLSSLKITCTSLTSDLLFESSLI